MGLIFIIYDFGVVVDVVDDIVVMYCGWFVEYVDVCCFYDNFVYLYIVGLLDFILCLD